AGHLSTFGIRTNDSFKKKDSQLNSKKEKKIKDDLEKLLNTIESEGYQKSANEIVKQKHLERVNQLKTELEAIRQIIS
uniref:Valyl-tRNA synthetase tRNA-binding arm domain-containing protein n=1 Tax=Megaselia scalaris TaxID=36166 RepID=T1H0W4_MEGSC